MAACATTTTCGARRGEEGEGGERGVTCEASRLRQDGGSVTEQAEIHARPHRLAHWDVNYIYPAELAAAEKVRRWNARARAAREAAAAGSAEERCLCDIRDVCGLCRRRAGGEVGR